LTLSPSPPHSFQTISPYLHDRLPQKKKDIDWEQPAIRADSIPARLCSPRFSIGSTGASCCHHGFNAAALQKVRVPGSRRGNTTGNVAVFVPAGQTLVFAIPDFQECDFLEI
jgi:hypothetical protein